MKLTVTNAFGPYAVGYDITDSKEIEAILASDNAANVVKVAVAAPVTADKAA
jgi:hypothetical protein